MAAVRSRRDRPAHHLDGALDTSFGVGGVVHVVYGANLEQFNDVALQPDGTILVAGTSSASTATGAGTVAAHDVIVAKLLPNGSLDSSFDLDGKVLRDLGGDDEALALAIQSDGRMLFAGQMDDEWAVLRLISTVTFPVARATAATLRSSTPTGSRPRQGRM